VSLGISRRGEARTVEVTLVPDPGHSWQLRVSPAATGVQSQHLEAWLAQQGR
jgi:hypothetical protein